MVLDRGDYDLTELYSGGIDPTSPIDTVTTVIGGLAVMSLLWWMVRWSQNRGSNLLENIASNFTGGLADSEGDVEVFN